MNNKENNHTIGIIGTGRLGICFALLLDQAGYKVLASDIRKNYIDELQQRKIKTYEPNVENLLKKSHIQFSTDTQQLIKKCEILYIMVATPSNLNGSYNISAVNQVVDDILNCDFDISGKILVIGCTTNPGDCQSIQDKLRPFGINVLYNPEFITQGSIIQDLRQADIVLIGGESNSIIEKYEKIYFDIQKTKPNIHKMSLTAAEIVKIAINCFLTTKISFANMIGEILSRSNLENDINIALEAIGADSRIGKKYLKYGFGFGGPCLPRDNRSFANYASKVGLQFPLGQIVDKFNHDHGIFLENYFIEKNLENLPFYIKNISYKPNSDIIEESQQYLLCLRLLEKGYMVIVEPNHKISKQIVNNLKVRFSKLIRFESKESLISRKEKIFEIPL